MLDRYNLKKLVERALAEDIGYGDLTTSAIVSEGQQGKGDIFVKDQGVIAGLPVAETVFQALSPQIHFKALVKDGAMVEKGRVIASLEGDLKAILTGERTALNFLQRLSGIATLTKRYVMCLESYSAVLIDTRKTTPGLRFLEKYATRVGGAVNHRFGLFDAVLIKENHIRAAGGLKKAVSSARKNMPFTSKIEVEVSSLQELEEALASNIDIIMLDNMEPAVMQEAVKMTGGKIKLEASGKINEENICRVAATGVDYISVGALTHSALALDISLLLSCVKA